MPAVTVSIDRHCATLSLSNGRQNVIDFAVMEELAASLTEIEQDPRVTTIVLRGDGENFSAGVDIPSHTPDKVATMLEKFHTAVRLMARSSKVLLAEVRGNCLGGGAELALMCDMVFTTPDARWGFPEITLACFPPVACAVLAVCVGQKRAAELVLTGRSFTGADAAAYGLANAAGDASALTRAAVEQLGARSSQVLPIAKRALYAWHAVHWDKALAHAERLYLDELVKQPDMERAIRDWSERKPK